MSRWGTCVRLLQDDHKMLLRSQGKTSLALPVRSLTARNFARSSDEEKRLKPGHAKMLLAANGSICALRRMGVAVCWRMSRGPGVISGNEAWIDPLSITAAKRSCAASCYTESEGSNLTSFPFGVSLASDDRKHTNFIAASYLLYRLRID